MRTVQLVEDLPMIGPDLAHTAATGSHRNGIPETRPYRWRRGDTERDAEIAARLAAIRALVAARAS
jgi:hypothetical protein